MPCFLKVMYKSHIGSIVIVSSQFVEFVEGSCLCTSRWMAFSDVGDGNLVKHWLSEGVVNLR